LQERIFRKLFEVAEIAAFTREERSAYEDSLKHLRDLNNVIDTARREGVEEGEVRGRVLNTLQLLEEGDLSSEKAKSRIDALRPELDDENFWAEVDKKLKKL
jgi:pyocin large subunit-like protein